MDRYKILNLPPSFYYIPNFITTEEEKQLLNHIYAVPLPKWVVLSGRRLQSWGGIPHPKGMLTERIPQWLRMYMDRVSSLGLFGENNANHVLINEYKAGQGISPHHDGPLYYPVVTTINLGSYGVLDFYRPIADSSKESSDDSSFKNRYLGSVLLQPRSLNVVADQLYTYYMHGIEPRGVDYIRDAEVSSLKDGEQYAVIKNWKNCELGSVNSADYTRSTRISVTIRYVPNVSKLDMSFLLRKV